MRLRIVLIDSGGSVHLAADGPMVGWIRSAADNPFLDLLGERWATHGIILDLEDATAIDSAAVGWLLSCYPALQRSGGRLVLHSAPPSVRRVLRMLKVDLIYPVAEDGLAASAAVLRDAA